MHNHSESAMTECSSVFSRFSSTTTLRTALLSSAIYSVSGAALAQSAQSQQQAAFVLEEVHVTARKRVESLQTVPVAVTVMNADAIQKSFAQNLGDMGSYAPNVNIGVVPGFNAAAIAIRGVSTGDIPSSFDPAVTVAVDGFYLGHYQGSLLDMFDIEQIEILRGPQGTLFGKNTIGGVVNITTKKPSGELGGQVKLRIGNEGRQDIMGAIDFPIIDDILAARISVQKFDFDGFYTNTFDGSDAGGQDLLAMRGKLLWTPNDSFEALLSVEYLDDDSDTPMVVNTTTELDPNGYYGSDAFYPFYPGRGSNGSANVPLGDPFKTGLVPPSEHVAGLAAAKDTDGHEENAEGVYLTINWDVLGGTLTAISGYRDLDSDYYNDYLGEPAAVYATIRSVYRETLSQEIRFAASVDHLDYVVGIYYQENDLEYENYTSLGDAHPFVPGLFLTADGSQQTDTWAVFGEGSYHLSSATQLTLGFRYSDEEKDFDLRPLGFPANLRADESGSWDDITYRVGIDHSLDENTLIYATFSTGFKSGGFNEQAGTLTSAAFSFDPEQAESFEVGMKSDLFEKTLRLNMAAFLVEYSDLQLDSVISIPVAPGQESVVTNAGEVTSWGVEADMMWLASENLAVDATLGYLNAEYDEFACNLDKDISNGNEDCTVLEVKRTPDWSASLGATYHIPLAGLNGGLDLNINATYTDEFYNDIFNSEASLHEEITLLNASVSYVNDEENLRVSLFGRNITDEEYQTSGLGVANLWSFSTFGNPVTYGLEVDVQF